MKHSDIGNTYDCSLAFPKNTGFRNSISTPFRIFSESHRKTIPLIEIPTSLMDDHLFGYFSNKRFENPYKEIDSLIEGVIRSEGILVIDYHVRGYNEVIFPNWLKSFEYIIKSVLSRGECYVDTPINIVNCFLERESILSARSNE